MLLSVHLLLSYVNPATSKKWGLLQKGRPVVQPNNLSGIVREISFFAYVIFFSILRKKKCNSCIVLYGRTAYTVTYVYYHQAGIVVMYYVLISSIHCHFNQIVHLMNFCY